MGEKELLAVIEDEYNKELQTTGAASSVSDFIAFCRKFLGKNKIIATTTASNGNLCVQIGSSFYSLGGEIQNFDMNAYWSITGGPSTGQNLLPNGGDYPITGANRRT